MKTEKYTFEEFLNVIAMLRAPGGCPWDRAQTHQSIKSSVIEEAYELAEAIDSGNPEKIADESGDLLLQVVLHAQIAADAGEYDMSDVADLICRKMIHRHPHVFGSEESETGGAEDWDEIKRKDRQQQTVTDELKAVSKALPALMRAVKIQKKAVKAGYLFQTESVPETTEMELGRQLFSIASKCREEKIDPETALSKYLQKFIEEFEKYETEKEQSK